MTGGIDAEEEGWREDAPPLGTELEFETPAGERGRGRLMAMENGRYALETPHEDFTGSSTFFGVSRWRLMG